MPSRRWSLLTLAAIMVLQILLFRSFVKREVAPDVVLKGDPTWYTFFAYDTRDALARGDWARLKRRAAGSPWGMMLFLQSGVVQLLLGSSRATVLSLNLIYYFLAQAATFWFFSRVGKSHLVGLVAVMLFMALQSPFRGGFVLNMRDFHFDLILYFLLLVAFYVIAWSKVFGRRGASIWVGAFAAYVVSMRLVSVSLFGTACGTFFLVLLIRYWLGSRDNRPALGPRIGNFLISTGVFLALSAIPILIARKALYNHYFRYVFEPEFRKTREGLYVMGTESKLGEALVLVKANVMGDLGVCFLIALAGVISWTVFWRCRSVPGAEASDSGDDHRPAKSPWLGRRLDRRLFIEFLWCAAGSSYLMHLAFPVKSPHMTRATAAPVFVLVLVYLLPWLKRTLLDAPGSVKLRAGGVLAIAAAAAIVTQCRFYLGPGRHTDRMQEMRTIARMFDDMGHIADGLKTESLAVSVDFIADYTLGAVNYCAYQYERYGVLRAIETKLGFPIDEPVAKDEAIRLLHGSDVVILARQSDPSDLWPFTRSVRPMQEELRKFVEGRFLHHGTYTIDGYTRDLYRRVPWMIEASASTEERFGPEWLLQDRLRIWHAPWDGKTPQWVAFSSSPAVVKIKALTIEAQHENEDRAPRSFIFQGSHNGQDWRDILAVDEAGLSAEAKIGQWDLPETDACKHFRLYITRNNGNPSLLTIWNMKFHLAGPPVMSAAAE